MTSTTSLKYPTPASNVPTSSSSSRTLASQPAAAAPSESRIDRDSHFNGLYETKQNLRIEGIAEGEIQCEGTLTVAEGARVKAKVTASTITIAGDLEGEVVCRGVFQIMPSGQVDATVSARRLIVQEGGIYNGEFSMITDQAGTPEPATSAPGPKATAKDLDPSTVRAAGTLSTDDWWAKMAGGGPPAGEPKTEGEKPKPNGDAKSD